MDKKIFLGTVPYFAKKCTWVPVLKKGTTIWQMAKAERTYFPGLFYPEYNVTRYR